MTPRKETWGQDGEELEKRPWDGTVVRASCGGSQDGRCWPGNERAHSGVGFGVKALVPRIENIK